MSGVASLDSYRQSRLLQHPNPISFASFNPITATSSDISGLRRPSLHDEPYRSRVAIETIPSGESFWCFVPNAKREDGCVDEGTWPRAVEICGQSVECSLYEWEIYKLDPEFECLVRMPPNKSIISRVSAPQQEQPTTQPLAQRKVRFPNDGKYICAACVYMIGCVAVAGWMLVSGPKLVPRQDTRITNVILSIGSKIALYLALFIVTLRLRAQWVSVLVSGRCVPLRGLLAACGGQGSFSRVRHIRTVPTMGVACTAVVGAAVTILMTFTSAGFKYVSLPGTAVQEFLGPDFLAICNYSLVNLTSRGYFCQNAANTVTVTTEWNSLDLLTSGAGGNILLSDGRTGTMSANVTLTSAPADLRLPTEATPPWAAVDVSCRAVELQMEVAGNGSTSTNNLLLDGRLVAQLSIAEMPTWVSQLYLYQQVNDTGPYSGLSPWYMVLLGSDLNDGTANIGGLSGSAVNYLGNSFLDFHTLGPTLQGILGAAAHCNFSGSTGGNWPSSSWPAISTTNVVVGTGPHNGTIDVSTVFLNYGPSWQYSPVASNAIPGESVAYIANWTVEADNFADYVTKYMRNQWALMMYTNNYITGYVTNTSYTVRTPPQLFIQTTFVVLLPMVALAVTVCCAVLCLSNMLGLGDWYERVDVAPWWLLKATGVAGAAGLEGRNGSKSEFEAWCKRIQCMYSVNAPDDGAGVLTMESTVTTTKGERNISDEV